MKALTYHADDDQFVMAELPQPKATGFDVVVKVFAAGLNPVDSKIHLWQSAAPGMNDNWVPGLDVSGEIVAVGEEVTQWQVGDKVLYHGDMFRPHGAFAEYAVQDCRTLVAHPEVSAEVAAASPCAGWTAYRALVDKLHAKDHEAILILGGAGGVGGFAIQLAKSMGISTIITTASQAKHNYVHSLGATHIIDYRSQDIIGQVMAITDGAGVPIALDCVGGDNDIIAASCLGYEGQMVELVSTVRPDAYPDAFMKGLSFHQLSLGSGHRNGEKAQRDLVRAGEAFSTLLEEGEVLVPQLKTITLDQVGDELKAIREQRTMGKVVVKM
ncbi:zinc-binding dehydrogenase [Photobacterium sp. BZF1]|uniref:zinc-binding dehydrogenase n=1 Tax=Photobacterium sp. BZF1 TaxID=1904457 RepID=UPI001653B0B0|nr:zinc-binding dehydrogenase [Photobacterium sp. BZF1]MBC7003803.1 zinc-binding dehydrogenase [Photobacterium sp. BZF1]